jgi:hypothetical protein
MDLQAELGYGLNDAEDCAGVHCNHFEPPEENGYLLIHEEHVCEEGYDCSCYLEISRPERNLGMNQPWSFCSLAITLSGRLE